jgi:dipeptidase D
MSPFENLHPAQVWHYFEEICRIPRPSKKEDKIIGYLISFAKKHGLKWKKDRVGNVLIIKPPTKGFERKKTVILQSHMDMVCEKNSGTTHNFETDPVIPYIDGEWIKARGTTLGADDGIGMAAQLAVLASGDLPHGKLECLFTVDEETGLTGAFALEPGFFEGSILINLDSEDEGELFIGCAGGIDTTATLKFDSQVIPSGYKGFRVSVGGLQGGHSGDDIHRGRGNSIKIINRFLWNISSLFDMKLVLIKGGNLRNAIPREAEALFAVHPDEAAGLKDYLQSFSGALSRELAATDPGFHISLKPSDLPGNAIDEASMLDIIYSLYGCPNGVMAWSTQMSNLVESSTNLATVRTGDNSFNVTTSQRSSSDSARVDISAMVESVFRLARGRVIKSDGYPGWEPDWDSGLLKICESAYERLFEKKPVVRTIHAGLECGLFLEKNKELEMISIGPTITGAHSPDERLNIASVEKFWLLLAEVLKEIPESE